MLVLNSKKLTVAATGQAFRTLPLAEAEAYTAFYHERAGNFLVGAGQVFAWVYSNPEAIRQLSTGAYDLVFFPPGRSRAMSFQGSILDEAWKAQGRRGHRELLALVDGFLYEPEGVPTLLIRRMSVRKSYRRNGLNAQLIKVLHSHFPTRALAFEDLTKEGYDFVRQAFPQATHVWSTACTMRPKGYPVREVVAA